MEYSITNNNNHNNNYYYYNFYNYISSSGNNPDIYAAISNKQTLNAFVYKS